MHQVPGTLTAHQIQILQTHLGGARDGILEDVHQARVSTRRLRELLPLVGSASAPTTRLSELVRDIGRALGIVRELDILMALSERLMELHPAAAAELATDRVELHDQRQRAGRRLVKRLDHLDVDALKDAVPARPFRLWRWRHALSDRIEARATKLERAVKHASGVYFPNRLHRVRIHLKKLRYLVEIAEQTDVWHPPHFRRDASRLQDLLGDIHDYQVLVDRFGSGRRHADLRSSLRAEILSRHAEYVRQRDRVHGMIAASHRFVDESRRWGRTIASGAAIALWLPVGAALMGRNIEDLDPDRLHVA
jgi:CHAD domain-containing protein